MSIETTEDWNDRMSCLGCCSMPTLAVSITGQAIPAIAYVNGYFNTSDSTFYLTYRTEYTGGGFRQEDWSPEFYGSVGTGGGALSVIFSNGYIVTLGDPRTGNLSVVLSNVNDPTAALTAGRSAISAAVDWDVLGKIAGSQSSLSESGAGGGFHYQIFRYYRFRFKMPLDSGNYGLFTYDIIEEPEVGAPFVLLEDQTIEWTGPGADLGDNNHPSWFTDYIYIEPPTVIGRRYVANCRFTPFTSTRYGLKPQVFGTAFP